MKLDSFPLYVIEYMKYFSVAQHVSAVYTEKKVQLGSTVHELINTLHVLVQYFTYKYQMA